MPSFKQFRALKVFKTTGLFLANRDPAHHQEVLFHLFLPGLETLHIFVFQPCLATGVLLKLPWGCWEANLHSFSPCPLPLYSCHHTGIQQKLSSIAGDGVPPSSDRASSRGFSLLFASGYWCSVEESYQKGEKQDPRPQLARAYIRPVYSVPTFIAAFMCENNLMTSYLSNGSS